MKSLLVMRHAKSSWKGTELSDFDRPLKARGKRDAPTMGEHLRSLDLVPDLILSSAAKRARTTAKRVAKACHYRGEIRLSDRLYLAEAGQYVEMLADLGYEERDLEKRDAAGLSCVMVVGHNPGLEHLVYELSAEHHEMPTAAVAVIDLEIKSWIELESHSKGVGNLRSIYLPREIAETNAASESA